MTADKHEIISIARTSTEYPKNVELYLGKKSPESVHMIGNRKILDSRLTALFCSSKCPGDAILKTYDLAQSLRSEGKTIISGFHSPMEKECLEIFLHKELILTVIDQFLPVPLSCGFVEEDCGCGGDVQGVGEA